MAEYIKREDALYALGAITAYKGSIPFDTAVSKIKAISAIDVEGVKHGKWVLYNKGFGFTHYCSNCNFEVKEQWIGLYNFCPNCGAWMESGGEDEQKRNI